jgi:hypothetical protein
MIADVPTVFWRARPKNPIVDWYTKACDGWAVFPILRRGLHPDASAIEYALAQPVDIAPQD